MMHGVGAGFCPLEELVQGGRYGRRPPGRSPGKAPLRGASPLRSSGGPAADLLRPAQAVKRESDPVPHPGKAPALFIDSAPAGRFFCTTGGGAEYDGAAGGPPADPLTHRKVVTADETDCNDIGRG